MPDYTITSSATGSSPEIRCITISGDMTIPHISGIRTDLLRELEAVEQATLDLGAISSIDVTGLQLLCSAHRSFVRKGKLVAISGVLNDVVGTAAGNAGLVRNICCVANASCDCLWSGGEQL